MFSFLPILYDYESRLTEMYLVSSLYCWNQYYNYSESMLQIRSVLRLGETSIK